MANGKQFEVSNSDFIALENFALKWRWTDGRYKKFPDSVLSQINPLKTEKASELYNFQNQFSPFENFQYETVADENYIKTDIFDDSAVKNWLENKIGADENFIFLCWDKDWAIRTTPKVFCDYWQDFCYPASDDIVVTAEKADWIIVYHHEEYLFFRKI